MNKSDEEFADQISDQVVDLFNKEGRSNPVFGLAGICLAVVAITRTTPAPRPAEVIALEKAAAGYARAAQQKG